MRRVFVDTAYYVAALLPNDSLRPAVVLANATFTAETELVSAEPIFVEVLAHVSRLGPAAREAAVAMIDELRADDRVAIVRQTSELFDAGLSLYRRRLDKGYSLTDCMSMFICQQSGITEVLTHDRHFEQEGFTILL